MHETSVVQLCARLQADFNVARAIPVARAALGLMVVLRTWVGSGRSAKVALSANVCHEVVAAVLGAGCSPIFCDVDPSNSCVPEKEWERVRLAGASVALVVHIYGNPSNIGVVRRHFLSSECLVIEDAAQAFGAFNEDGSVGSQGDVGLLSFGNTKHIDTGGAALLFRDIEFASRFSEELLRIEVTPPTQMLAIYSGFRSRLEQARCKLRSEGVAAATAFHGLLDGYFPYLQCAPPAGSAADTCLALDKYPESRKQRLGKALAWETGLTDCGITPVGMGVGSVPWRYTCRIPGIGWATQFRLGEAMRAHGIQVSHWYLPAHWMCGYVHHTLPHTERLASEIFQFWVDSKTLLTTIEHHAAVVSAIVKSFHAGER